MSHIVIKYYYIIMSLITSENGWIRNVSLALRKPFQIWKIPFQKSEKLRKAFRKILVFPVIFGPRL